MKKWMKGLTIAGVIFIFAGTGISAWAAMAGGAGMIRNFGGNGMRGLRNGFLSLEDGSPEPGEISSKEDMKVAATYKDVWSLELEVENANVQVVENPELKDEIIFYVKEKKGHGFSHKAKNDGRELSVTYYSRKNSNFYRNYGEGIVEIPPGYKFNEAELDVAVGEIYAPFIAAKSLKLSTQAGFIGVDSLEAQTLEVDSQAGAVQAQGAISGNLSVEVQAGSVQLSLWGSQTDYQYQLESGLGSIRIGDRSYEGLNMEKTIGNAAGRKAELECQVGSIELDFYE